MRPLAHHEAKLLRKVDFLSWAGDDTREAGIIRRYALRDRAEYMAYNKLAGAVTGLATKLKALPAGNPVRVKATEQLLAKLYAMGVIPTATSLAQVEKLSASAFARRRLPVVLMRLKFAETLREACTLVEHGHIRVGPEVVTDPAFIVTRTFEDFITWVDSSKIKRTVARYNDRLDDYELLGE